MQMTKSSSQIALISSGEIGYALVGKGPTVLVSHGTLGGFDQALTIARLFDQDRFSFLAPSRAGYLRSSPETGRTPQEQARSFVELLDLEGIASVAVMGLSGGSPAAIRFASEIRRRNADIVTLSALLIATMANMQDTIQVL